MSDETIAPDNDAVVVPVSDSNTSTSPRDLARSLADWRYKRAAGEEPKEPEQPAAPTEAAAEPESTTDAPADEATVDEATVTTEPAEELPPIEPPRSWTKEEKEEFKSYPREVQEKVARREQDRETALRRGQNETAEQRKALEAQLAQAEQVRHQYEQALPLLLQTLQDTQQGEFSDIKTMADVEKLAREDWPRYALWDAQQKKIAAVQQELSASQQRQAQDFQRKWAEFSAAEDAKFIERAPEMADKAKATEVADAAVAALKDVGFSEQDLVKLWNGEASLSLRDHRVQLIIRDAIRSRQAQKEAVKKVAAKPVPPVQRPGVAPPKGAADDAKIKNLEQQLERTGSAKVAAELLLAKRAAGR